MSAKNVKLVQKTKEALNELGIDVKPTQIYEMYSKVLGYKKWNVLQSKAFQFPKKLVNLEVFRLS